jgi:hypothetical protein
MRRRGIATVGLGAAAGLAVYAVLATGVLAGGTGRLAGAAQRLVAPPAAAADELPAFDGCEQLRRWYVRAALPQVGPWGLQGPPMLYARPMAGDERVPLAAGGAQDAVGVSSTGTNVQDPDVDESDVAKTDGRIVARIAGRSLVLTDVSGHRPRELSRTMLPGTPMVQAELLLKGDRVVVVGDQPSVGYEGPIHKREALPGDLLPHVASDPLTRVVSLDISNPSAPRVSDDLSIDGGALSTREYPDGTVRVVLSTGSPPLDFVHPNRDRTLAEATAQNRRIVQDAPVQAWLPGVRSGSGAKRPLLGCSDVRHPVRPSGLGTLSVLSFPFDEAGRHTATAVTASGDLVYSSADRLYVATYGDRSTQVHAFALDAGRTSYVGSGSVPGTVRDRWSFDEYDGHLRVATTTSPAPTVGIRPDAATRPSVDVSTTAVTVLDERDGRLVPIGRVDGLGEDEQVKAVRWFGDLAVVVTFRQTDPLYTLDLSDPEHPRLLGELEAPGFSAYLHPVGDDLLVGIGHDATTRGADLGTQAAAFDLRDPGHVRRTDTLALGRDAMAGAETDPRAFTYLPDRRTLVTPVESWRTATSRFAAVHVSPDGQLRETASWAAHAYTGSVVRALPLGGGRLALVDDTVRVVQVP